MFLDEQQEEKREEELGSWRNHGWKIIKCIWRKILKSQLFMPEE